MIGSSRRAAKLILATLAMAVIVLGVSAWEPVWMFVTTTTEFVSKTTAGPFPSPITSPVANLTFFEVRGWVIRDRWGDKEVRSTVFWYVATGFKLSETTDRGITYWNPDGTVRCQFPLDTGYGKTSTSPPWLWGVIDQSEPNAPWWNNE